MSLSLPLVENLKALRKLNALTQSQVAEQLNVSTVTYNKFENENVAQQPNPTQLVALADLFNISIDELLGREFSSNGTTMKKLQARIEIEKEIDVMFDEAVNAKRLKIIEETLRKMKL